MATKAGFSKLWPSHSYLISHQALSHILNLLARAASNVGVRLKACSLIAVICTAEGKFCQTADSAGQNSTPQACCETTYCTHAKEQGMFEVMFKNLIEALKVRFNTSVYMT